MRINADFEQRAVVRFADTPWVPSPAAGVERKMLDRIGEEVARATTIVRFAPGSSFDAHTHDGGEEYLVLEGEFQDETGNFPVGAYVRNPPTSRHTPAASKGAVILVKLHQFDPADRVTVHVDSNASNDPVVALFEDESEQVSIETWEPGQRISRLAPSGMEVFILEGECREGDDVLSRWDWLRLPPEGEFEGQAGPEGARVWIKTGRLPQMGEK